MDYPALIKEVADAIRSGTTQADALASIAAEWEAPLPVLTARFERAYPDGVPAAPPSKEENERRRVAAIRAERRRAVAEHNAIVAFFNDNPEQLYKLRRHIHASPLMDEQE